jgi:3-phenylpropionate/trans-cinnamate dioxygenase ferredoxin reductase subunit
VIRLESVQNAMDQGRHVAAEILGHLGDYDRLPLFWSEQSGVRLQIAGLSTGYDDCITLGDAEGCNFSSFCFLGGNLVAVESVNRPADHMSARKCLNACMTPGREIFDESGFDFRAWVKSN